MRVMVTRPQVSLGDVADDYNYEAKRASLASPMNMLLLGVLATLGAQLMWQVWKDNRR